MSLAVLSAGVGEDNQFVFEVSADRVRTWQEMRRSGAARWAKHDVFQAKPKREFLGPDSEKLTLSGIRLDMERGVVPLDEINKLRSFRDSGVVLQFTVGIELIGDFLLESIDEDWKRVLQVNQQGTLVIASVALTLEEYA